MNADDKKTAGNLAKTIGFLVALTISLIVASNILG